MGAAYVLAGTQWQLSGSGSDRFTDAAPFGTGVVRHYTGFIGSNRYESVLTGAIGGRWTWSGDGYASISSLSNGFFIHNIPNSRRQGADTTEMRLFLGTGPSRTVGAETDSSSTGARAAAIFRGRFVVGGDFTAVGETAGAYLAIEAPGGWRSLIDAPLGTCDTLGRTPDGKLLSIWNTRIGWIGVRTQSYLLDQRGWTRLTPTSFYQDYQYRPRFHSYGNYTAIWPGASFESFYQLEGDSWTDFVSTGLFPVAFGDFFASRWLADGRVWNGRTVVSFPPLRTAFPCISVQGRRYGSLVSNANWCVLEGQQWRDLGPLPAWPSGDLGGHQFVEFQGAPVYGGTDGRVRQWRDDQWITLGSVLTTTRGEMFLQEWRGVLYCAGNALRTANGTANLARWDGSNWIAVPDIGPGRVTSIQATAEGLWVAGEFTSVEGRFTRGLALLTSPCASDIDCSGGVDGNDIVLFFEGWDTGAPQSDINRDGGVDADDMTAFFADWNSGRC